MKVSPIIPQRGVGCLRLTTARWLEVEAAALLCVGSGNCEVHTRTYTRTRARGSQPNGPAGLESGRPPGIFKMAAAFLQIIGTPLFDGTTLCRGPEADQPVLWGLYRVHSGLLYI
ncbi:hypothetical protein J6590_068468 [Homalodisca vitripennis]|nr:hypothetical protein J6590_068468 [Homalodisca vitripennis]